MVDEAVEGEVSRSDEAVGLGGGYLRRLLGYATKVYVLGAVLARVRDGRQHPQIPVATVIRAVFGCGLLRVRSFNALEPQLGEPQLLCRARAAARRRRAAVSVRSIRWCGRCGGPTPRASTPCSRR
jgi:hypothetical protein